MAKTILLVIDGLGIGQMNDVALKANTWKTILANTKKEELSFLKTLMTKAFSLKLDYQGADSFLGHLTMSGVDVKQIKLLPLAFYQEKIIAKLKAQNYDVSLKKHLLVVNDAVIISDNFEAASGLAFNLNGCRDLISQKQQTEIAQIVRSCVEASRVISFGAKKMSIANYFKYLLNNDPFYGLDTPKTGVYNQTYDVIHLAKKINYQKSIQVQLLEQGYQVYMYGKFSDIIDLGKAVTNHKIIKTQAIFDQLFSDLTNSLSKSFFCVNIQESDLAGHSSDIKGYIKVLKVVEHNLRQLIRQNQDVNIIITSDHGNDPAVTNGQHTREKVPFIYLGPKKQINKISKLSDIAKFIKEI